MPRQPAEIRQLLTYYCEDFMESGKFDGQAYLKLLAYATTQRKPDPRFGPRPKRPANSATSKGDIK